MECFRNFSNLITLFSPPVSSQVSSAASRCDRGHPSLPLSPPPCLLRLPSTFYILGQLPGQHLTGPPSPALLTPPYLLSPVPQSGFLTPSLNTYLEKLNEQSIHVNLYDTFSKNKFKFWQSCDCSSMSI